MCGIAGYIGRNPPSDNHIAATLLRMKNRGPDCQTSARFLVGENALILLHSRLSIIDGDPRSNQPLTVGDCTVVFNGEIYNYIELRQEIIALGAQFRTDSDTEVLVQAYRFWGEGCVNRFEGMWAFALYDAGSQTLLLSRDRFGEKPLYVHVTPHGFYFGSEIKFLRTLAGHSFPINERHLLRYLVNGYKSLYKTSETFFQGVREIPYATNLLVRKNNTQREWRYWTPHFSSVSMTREEAVEGMRTRLLRSMQLRLRADVPLAFCLSGGVDSAALVSIAVKKFGYSAATFSILDSDARYNEYTNIRATIDDLQCPHTIIELSKKDFFPRLQKLIRYHDAPISTISYYVHALLSEAIAKNGFRVAISGTAADEIFTGYYDHFNLFLYAMRDHPRYKEFLKEWQTYIAPMVRNPYLRNPKLYFTNPSFRGHMYLHNDAFASYLNVPFQEGFTEEKFCDPLLRNRMLNELFHEVVPPILHEDDLNSMYYSIENRSPYLDSNLFTFSYSIPTEYLMDDGYAKNILRQAVKGILNDTVRLDRQKKGFNASIQSLLDLQSKDNQEYILSPGRIFDYVSRDTIAAIIRRDIFPNSFSKFLFNFLNAKLFLEHQSD